MPKHYAKAVWEGDLPHGKGKFILETSGYEAPFQIYLHRQVLRRIEWKPVLK